MKLPLLFRDPVYCRRFLMMILERVGMILLSVTILGFLTFAATDGQDHPSPESPPAFSSPVLPLDKPLFPSEECLLPSEEPALALDLYDDLFARKEEHTIPTGELRIVATDLSKNPSVGDIFWKNNTSYALTPQEFLTATAPSLPTSVSPAVPEEAPLVLIYHSHGTEGYAEEGRASYPAGALPRTEDTEKNVVAVGRLLTEVLNASGVPTIHCEIMHDAGGQYNYAYENSAKTLKEYLKAYPTIRYAFDIHRDALQNETTVYKTLTYDESTPVAQIMLVVGTDDAGANHPDWRKNLSFAVDAQYYLTQRLNHLVRPLSIKTSSYNQQHPAIGLLIEVGTCVNTLAEAKASAVILGKTLAGMILLSEQGEGNELLP